MAHELRFVDRDVLDADGTFVAIDIYNAVDHDKRIAMRQQPQDIADLDSLEAFDTHVWPPSDRPPETCAARHI